MADAAGRDKASAQQLFWAVRIGMKLTGDHQRMAGAPRPGEESGGNRRAKRESPGRETRVKQRWAEGDQLRGRGGREGTGRLLIPPCFF